MQKLKISAFSFNINANNKIHDILKSSCLYEILEQKYDLIAINIIHEEHFAKNLNNILNQELKKFEYKFESKTDYLGHNENSESWRGITLFIYSKKSLDLKAVYETNHFICDDFLIKKGAILIKIIIPDKNINFGFLSLHMPYNTHSINTITMKKNSNSLEYHMQERSSVWNRCINNIFNKLVFSEKLDGVIIMSDQNYQLSCNDKDIDEYINKNGISKFRDEVDDFYHNMKKGEIPMVVEGVNAKGPTHVPYHKEPQGNIEKYEKDLNKNKCKMRNWYDRIFYQVYSKDNDAKIQIKCLKYDICNEEKYSKNYSSTYCLFEVLFS